MQSLLYQLERFEIGVVWLDRERRVIGMNDFASATLKVAPGVVFLQEVLSFHPERSRDKVKWLLDTAECPVANPPPMAMMISIPERVLLIKVSKVFGENREANGFSLVFHDITEVVSQPSSEPSRPMQRELKKLPALRQNRIVLVDTERVLFIRSEGHYTQVVTAECSQFCNLAISDLEERLDSTRFQRVHRSYIVNLDHAEEIVKNGSQALLRMNDAAQTEIPVSRSALPRLLQVLGIAQH
jgi:LytTR family transcriptional regulator, CO-responsive transcriptional regulator RcoM